MSSDVIVTGIAAGSLGFFVGVLYVILHRKRQSPLVPWPELWGSGLLTETLSPREVEQLARAFALWDDERASSFHAFANAAARLSRARERPVVPGSGEGLSSLSMAIQMREEIRHAETPIEPSDYEPIRPSDCAHPPERLATTSQQLHGHWWRVTVCDDCGHELCATRIPAPHAAPAP